MKFCSQCGAKVALKIPDGDDRQRYVCDACGFIHYENPRVIVGCLPVYQGQVLLCLRAIEPRRNYWTLPAGFMENGETTSAGAARETWEEATAKVENLQLYRIFDVPYINQVYMFYRCDLIDGDYAPGIESLECGLYTEDTVPWDNIAFPVVKSTLRSFFHDQANDVYPVEVSALEYTPRRK